MSKRGDTVNSEKENKPKQRQRSKVIYRDCNGRAIGWGAVQDQKAS